MNKGKGITKMGIGSATKGQRKAKEWKGRGRERKGRESLAMGGAMKGMERTRNERAVEGHGKGKEWKGMERAKE